MTDGELLSPAGARWADRARNIRALVARIQPAGPRPSEVDGDAHRLAVVHALWSHLHGYTVGQVIDDYRAWSGVFEAEPPDQATVERWIEWWRRSGLEEPWHAHRLEVAWQVAAVVCAWTGRTIVPADDLPSDLANVWRRAEMAMSCTLDYDELAAQVEERDPDLARRAQSTRGDPYLAHLAGPRCMWELTASVTPEDGDAILRALERDLLLIELTGLRDLDELDVELIEVAGAARRLADVPYITRSAWAEPGDGLPGHIRDRIVTGGARFYRYGTGDVLCGAVYAEDADAEARLRRFCRAPHGLAISGVGTDRLIIELVLPLHEGDDEPAFGPFSFSLAYIDDRVDLVRLWTQRGMRLEVFGEVEGRVRCLDTGSVPITPEVASQLRAALVPWAGSVCDPEARLQERLAHRADDEPVRFDASEMARFEILWDLSHHAGREHLTGEERAHLQGAVRAYLATASEQRPQTDRLAQARADLFSALRPRVPVPRRRATELLADGVLSAPSRWILYVDLREGALDLVVGGRGPAGELVYERRTAPVTGDAVGLLDAHEEAMHGGSWAEKERTLQALAGWWETVTADLVAALSRRGVTDVVLCPGHGLEAIPMHISPAWSETFVLGYAASLALIDHPIDDLLGVGIDIHPGDVSLRPLPQVEAELRVVAAAHGGEVVTGASLLSPRHRLVHYAGHGGGGSALDSRALETADGPVTVAEILSSADYLGVDVVTLSACSTGAFRQNSDAPLELPGIDHALIAVGASSVVSTMWDVHDTAAALFMSVFHLSLAEGRPTAVCFALARDAVRRGPDGVDEAMDAALRRHWPSWRGDVVGDGIPGLVVHWGAFRMAGRYW